MKSPIRVILSVFVLAVLFTIDGTTDTKDIAFLFKSRGKVEIKQNGSKLWHGAKRGYRLNSGDKIRTGDHSLAALLFTDDKSLMKIRSRSDVVVKGERKQTSVAKTIFMQVGEVFVSVKKQQTVFRLETPTGVAAVKGTQFYGQMDEDGTFSILAISGIVELINKYGSVLVKAGEKGISTGDKVPQSQKAGPGDEKTWGQEGDNKTPQYDELEIPFKDKDGTIRTLRLRTKAKGKK